MSLPGEAGGHLPSISSPGCFSLDAHHIVLQPGCSPYSASAWVLTIHCSSLVLTIQCSSLGAHHIMKPGAGGWGVNNTAPPIHLLRLLCLAPSLTPHLFSTSPLYPVVHRHSSLRNTALGPREQVTRLGRERRQRMGPWANVSSPRGRVRALPSCRAW